MNNPCKSDCPERSIYCHTECELYKTYIQEQQKIKQKIKEERTRDYMFKRDDLRRAGKLKEEKK